MAKAGRKKKEEIDILIEAREKVIEETSIKIIDEEKQKLIEEILTINSPKEEVMAEVKNEMPEVLQLKNSEMSEQAMKWEKYIAMYKMTPEGFIEKYPYHIHRKFIEEIIEIRKEK